MPVSAEKAETKRCDAASAFTFMLTAFSSSLTHRLIGRAKSTLRVSFSYFLISRHADSPMTR
ncbi:hypothetical protein AXF42_Ash004629 [Apostasia shenzhenica]|uniref:Uncharacterized protein n=1 Tax=Apostasia shenzhenica TaxID=1088818 RepID=A0A2I0BH56_9ASPA|nr:hypothetical protein AXF42_Ash004629 [Apostasia shenzhenica]